MPGEESGRTGPADNGRTWLVDPLCGTLNFAVRNMLVAVNVALRVGTAVTVAASADPFTGDVFWTDGDAAYLRNGGVDERLVPSAESSLVDVNLERWDTAGPGTDTLDCRASAHRTSRPANRHRRHSNADVAWWPRW